VREQVGEALIDSLASHLRAKRALLLLDNCEHLVQVCAEFADVLLHACPALTILATIREPLATIIARYQRFVTRR
jgi:predicted ATPase